MSFKTTLSRYSSFSTLALPLALVLAFPAAHAQSTPAKKELAARIVKAQQAGIDTLARNLAEQPAAAMLERAAQVLPQRIPADKREAVANDIKADAKKYVDETVPMVRAAAQRIAPATIGAMLEEKFTEDELKQVIAIIEAPVYSKFQALGDDMQRVLIEKLLAETRTAVEPKLRALDQSLAKRLGITPAQSGAAPVPAARPAAKPASK